MFVRWRIPTELVSDNATQFVCTEFKEFIKKYVSQTNGAAERAVQTANQIVKQPDLHMALMCYRATAISATGASPAQLMTERQIRTTVPVLDGKLQPKRFSHNTVKQKDQKAKQAYQFFYNRRHTVRPLLELNPGQSVRVKLDGEKGWKTPAVVISKSPEPRSYVVETEHGTIAQRNRQHLQAFAESPTPERTTKESPTPERTTKESSTPERTTKESSTPKRTTKESPTPERTTKESPTPERTTKESPTPERTPKESPTPERTTKESPTPERTTKESPTPERTTKESPTPERTTKESPTPERTTKESPTPERTTKESPTPERTTKESPTPERTTKESPTPERTTKESPTPERTTKESPSLPVSHLTPIPSLSPPPQPASPQLVRMTSRGGEVKLPLRFRDT
uniref:Integrase catalytic domain-containing protein n=1 Tax=Salmo trutta TaxID=8032 RepID=A0A673W1F4_SALTR